MNSETKQYPDQVAQWMEHRSGLVQSSGVEMAQRVAHEMIDGAPPYSVQEYMGWAYLAATDAIRSGCNGVGAVGVIRSNGIEYVIVGRNKARLGVHTDHAEMQIIHALDNLFPSDRDTLPKSNGNIFVRAAPDNQDRWMLFTTLEPCGMCVSALATVKRSEPVKKLQLQSQYSQLPLSQVEYGFDDVIIARADDTGGSMLPEHIERLTDENRSRLAKGSVPTPARLLKYSESPGMEGVPYIFKYWLETYLMSSQAKQMKLLVPRPSYSTLIDRTNHLLTGHRP